MAVKTKTAIVYAKTSTSLVVDGLIVQVGIGEPWAGNDPLVISRPDLFQESPIVLVRTSTGWVHVDELT